MTSPRSFVGRQAVLDECLNLIGYELHFRVGVASALGELDPGREALGVIESSLNSHKLERLVGSGLAFVNATRELLLGEHLLLLDPQRTVLEVPSSVQADPEVVDACRALRQRGFALALDDYSPGAVPESLLSLADIVKVDFGSVRGDERAFPAERLHRRGAQLLALGVESYDDVHAARQLGYSLFQGRFLFEPEVVEHREVPRFKQNYVRFLSELGRPELDLVRIEAAIKQELSLSLKLLRYMNSSAFGLRHEIASIDQALVHLGERPLRRWGSLVGVACLGEDRPSELVRATLVRAFFCERLVTRTILESIAPKAFLVGLYSTLDALLGLQLAEVLDEVGVAKSIRHALMGSDSSLGRLFRLVLAYERAEWPRVHDLAYGLGLSDRHVTDAYVQALDATNEVFDQGLSEAA